MHIYLYMYMYNIYIYCTYTCTIYVHFVHFKYLYSPKQAVNNTHQVRAILQNPAVNKQII